MATSAMPKQYDVDLSRTTYRGARVPNIRETVYKAFSPEQALGFVLKRNRLSYLYEDLLPEVDELVAERVREKPSPRADMSDPEPGHEWKQMELFDIPHHYYS